MWMGFKSYSLRRLKVFDTHVAYNWWSRHWQTWRFPNYRRFLYRTLLVNWNKQTWKMCVVLRFSRHLVNNPDTIVYHHRRIVKITLIIPAQCYNIYFSTAHLPLESLVFVDAYSIHQLLFRSKKILELTKNIHIFLIPLIYFSEKDPFCGHFFE